MYQAASDEEEEEGMKRQAADRVIGTTGSADRWEAWDPMGSLHNALLSCLSSLESRSLGQPVNGTTTFWGQPVGGRRTTRINNVRDSLDRKLRSRFFFNGFHGLAGRSWGLPAPSQPRPRRAPLWSRAKGGPGGSAWSQAHSASAQLESRSAPFPSGAPLGALKARP